MQETLQANSPTHQIEAFFDDRCHLCHAEVALMKKWDRAGQILFVDISDPAFEPAKYGKTLDELMAQMHARLPDGQWIIGVEVFRRLYKIVGLGLPVAISRWPIISPLLNLGYFIFAKVRLKLPRRKCNSSYCHVE